VNKSILALATATALALGGTAEAANLRLINLDAPGVGLNNTTPAAPIGGNYGRTRGEQALIVYRYALAMWGGMLQSNVEVRVNASFAPLTCTATSGTLASAGTTRIFGLVNEDGVTRWHNSALADSLVGFDLQPFFGIPATEADINSRFNGNLGLPGCLEGSSWYFGLDGKTPAGATNFLNVVMHEVGHGLGVQGFLSTANGSLNGGRSDTYTRRAFDNVLNLPFEQMTNAQRLTAISTPGRTVWTGTNVNQQAKLIMDNRVALRMSAPGALAGKFYEVGFATFGTFATPTTFPNRDMVLVNDGVGATADGCELPFVNAAALAGKIAIIDRGTCGFSQKVKNAQDSGAAAVVVANNAAGVIDMGLTAGFVPTIPSVMISLADANEVKANLAGAAGGLATSPFLAGLDAAGRTRLYTPAVIAGGSTYSHFDTSLTPNALMEPFNTASLQAQVNVDLTPSLFADIGWGINRGNTRIGTCDTGVQAVADGGIVLGANVGAHYAMCKAQFPGNRLNYTKCMTDHGTSLRNSGFISSTQHMKIVQCTSLN
jgi:hypothetical protein